MRFLTSLLAASAASFVTAQQLPIYFDPDVEPTYFDGKKVPPLLELTPANWDEEVNKTQFLVVKNYSPYCPHCIDFAPTYQTFYEYYFTTQPNPEKPEDTTSFTEFYDLRFGMLNCAAYSDLCADHGVKTFPLTILYEFGEPRGKVRGVKDMTALTTMVEEALEYFKPGTRPTVLNLPEPGDHMSPRDAKKASETSSSALTDKKAQATEAAAPVETEEKDAIAKEKEFGDSWKETSTGDKLKEEAEAVKNELKTVNPMNPEGASVSLTPESFQKLVTETKDPWFVKFYAPWCHHCQALAPTWEQVGKTMKDKLNIGEVNCEVEKKLCKDAGVSSYPTMRFFSGGEQVEYVGLRGLGDLVGYSEKAVELAGPVPDVDAAQFAALEKKHDVLFTYFYDHATATEDFDALAKLPLSVIGHGKIVKTSDKKLAERFRISTWPRLMVVRDGRPDLYEPFTPMEMRDVHRILEWMATVWLPLVPELTATNAKQIMNNRIVVLGVLDREEKAAYEKSLREIKDAAIAWSNDAEATYKHERQKLRDAKQAKVEDAKARGDERGEDRAKEIVIHLEKPKEVGFAWIDGAFWGRWLRETYGVDLKNGETVIINDQDRRRYWDVTAQNTAITPSKTAILDVLAKIATDGPASITPKYTVSAFEKIFWDIHFSFVDRPLFSVCVVILCIFTFVYWLRNRRHRRGGHFRLDDGIGIKEGLIGSGSNGIRKAD